MSILNKVTNLISQKNSRIIYVCGLTERILFVIKAGENPLHRRETKWKNILSFPAVTTSMKASGDWIPCTGNLPEHLL